MRHPDQPDRLPTVVIGMRIDPAQSQGIIKNKSRRLEA
jgi:hypothetical protein